MTLGEGLIADGDLVGSRTRWRTVGDRESVPWEVLDVLHDAINDMLSAALSSSSWHSFTGVENEVRRASAAPGRGLPCHQRHLYG